VGYELPPSGLKTNSLEEQSNLAGTKLNFRDLPETPVEPSVFASRPKLLASFATSRFATAARLTVPELPKTI
jgi:hypothetical protein